MEHILVTGASGQLGSSIKQISENYTRFQFHFHGSETLDITDESSIAKVFTAYTFSYCINCAAYTNVEQAEISPGPAFFVNATGAQKIASACARHNTVLIHISTDYVFDGKKNAPYLPTDPPNPINQYGLSKLQGEALIQAVLKNYFIVRTSWLYSGYGKNFYAMILEKAKAGHELQITDEQKGCPTHAQNLATFILKLIDEKNQAFGLYHFTDGEAMTWYDFALRILQDNGLEYKVKLVRAKNYRTLAVRPKNSVLGN